MSYIIHYGVKGMKKGTRRWTNSDGSLNEAGKARYVKHVYSLSGTNPSAPGIIEPKTKAAREYLGKKLASGTLLAVEGKNSRVGEVKVKTATKITKPDTKKQDSGKGNETIRKRRLRYRRKGEAITNRILNSSKK